MKSIGEIMKDRSIWQKLVGKKVVPCSMEEMIADGNGDMRVVHLGNHTFTDSSRLSTVFLPLNHGFGEVSMNFETMFFPSDKAKREEDQWRYHSYDEAVANHRKLLNELIAEGFKIKDGTDVVEENEHARNFLRELKLV